MRSSSSAPRLDKVGCSRDCTRSTIESRSYIYDEPIFVMVLARKWISVELSLGLRWSLLRQIGVPHRPMMLPSRPWKLVRCSSCSGVDVHRPGKPTRHGDASAPPGEVASTVEPVILAGERAVRHPSLENAQARLPALLQAHLAHLRAAPARESLSVNEITNQHTELARSGDMVIVTRLGESLWE